MVVLYAVVIVFFIAAAIAVRFYFAVYKRGNSLKYLPSRISQSPDSPLKDKTIYCLGSSITCGLESFKYSFTDYLHYHTGCRIIRDAVPSSTLASGASNSYVNRFNKSFVPDVDIVVIQLSTNDTVFRSKTGSVTPVEQRDGFDAKTTIGAIEYIASQIRLRSKAEIYILASPPFDSPSYSKLVHETKRVCEKWGMGMVDFWNAPVPEEVRNNYKMYMNDVIHPTLAGISLWWGPGVERELCKGKK